jgi:DNA-binding transcriptional LysR family regulator
MAYLESLRVFVRVVELGTITSGGRDLRLSPAVASNRVKELESRLGVRLLNRTTRNLIPTEAGTLFYNHARKIIDQLEVAEAELSGFSDTPKGVIRVLAPLGVGRRWVAPLVPEFVAQFPETEIRLRLSDRAVDLLHDGLDVAFFLGQLKDSDLKLRKIIDCERVLCAAPAYLEKYGVPEVPQDLLDNGHICLLLRFPGSSEYYWVLNTSEGFKKFSVSGRYDADDGDVLTDWALGGHGIVNKPRFDVSEHLASGALVEILPQTPPASASFGCLFPHRKLQDPKIRLFIDFAARKIRQKLMLLPTSKKPEL